MSELSGGGSAGFRPVNASITNQVQARQAELQQLKQQAVSRYGAPTSGDTFTRTAVAEKVVSTPKNKKKTA